MSAPTRAVTSSQQQNPSSGDVLSSLGLVLNLAAIIALALWLSMAGGARTGATMVAGTLTIALFAGSIVCFALDRPEQPHGDHASP